MNILNTLITALSIILLSSCNANNKAIENNKIANFSNIVSVYSEWRKTEIEKGNYNDSCLSTAIESMENLPARYALPKINDLGKYNDDEWKEIDTISYDINIDGKKDYLIKIKPSDCTQGNGRFSVHDPVYLLVVSDNDSYKIDNTILKNINNTLASFFNNSINDAWANAIYIDKMVDSEEGSRTIIGSFEVWIGEDANCCPSVVANFTVYFSESSSNSIQIEGSVITDSNTETKKNFERKLRM